MGRREQTANHFGKRVKAERVARKWSQAQMATLLSDSGVPMIHATTIAKIEAGDRPTRIDEATAIADLFDISLDALLGREGMEDEPSRAMTLPADEAAQLMPEVLEMRERISRAYRPLQALGIAELEGRVFSGDQWDFQAPIEDQRALLIWWEREVALVHASALFDSLGEVAKLRTMGAVELRRSAKGKLMAAAVSQRGNGHAGA
jgi:transcriptional regulator with XRE-family HTH domain